MNRKSYLASCSLMFGPNETASMKWRWMPKLSRFECEGAFVWLTMREGLVYVMWRLKDGFKGDPDHGCQRVGRHEQPHIDWAMRAAISGVLSSQRLASDRTMAARASSRCRCHSSAATTRSKSCAAGGNRSVLAMKRGSNTAESRLKCGILAALARQDVAQLQLFGNRLHLT